MTPGPAERERKRGRRSARSPMAFLIATCLLAGRAAADGTADEADAHFRLGLEDYKKGAYDSAIAHFMQSNRLAPNRNVLFNIAGTYEAMARFTDAYRFYVDALQGETDTQQRATVEASIQRMTAKVALVSVTTDPPGATIYVDRKDLGSLGKTPRPLALPPGKHRVIVELDGFEARTSEEVDLVIGQEQKVSLSLTRIVGKLRVTTEGAAAAEVRVDDESNAPTCTAPCEMELSPGRHDLWLRAPGYEPATTSVVVEPNKTAAVLTKLVPLTGTLVVQTEERDATVLVDGKQVGFTPLVAPSIAAGKRAVRVELRGFQPFERKVEIEPHKQLDLSGIRLLPLREVNAASRTSESIDDAPSSVTIIDRRELAAFGYPTIEEAVRGVRGFVVGNDRLYPSIGARGTSQPGDYGNRILLLSDGQPLNDFLSSSTGVAATEGRVDLYDVDRIEVVRGPGSLLYGTGAFGGLINLVTRPPDAPTQAHVEAGVYDDHTIHGSAGFHYNLGKGRSIWATVAGAYSNGADLNYPDPSTPEVPRVGHRVGALSAQSIIGRATWGPLTAQWLFQRREALAPLGIFGTRFNSPDSVLTDTRFMSELRYEPQLTQSWGLFARFAVKHDLLESAQSYDDGSSIRERDPGTSLDTEVRAVYTPFSWLRLTGGGEVQAHPEVHLCGAVPGGGEVQAHPDVHLCGAVPGADPPYLDEDHPYVLGSAYAIADGSPARWLRFSVGVRGDFYSTFGSIAVPRGALILKPAEGHVLKLMGGRAFRAPSIFEQFYNDGGQALARSVDPAKGWKLSPESIATGELEYSYRFFQDWVALAAAHVSEVDHIIVTVPVASGSPVTHQINSDVPALIAGGELELRREWRRGLMTSATYGYQQARLLDSVQKDPFLAGVPEHLASFKLVVPVIEELVSFAFRAELEAPRRISTTSEERTRTAVVADAAISGVVRAIGLHYTLGLYNLADWQYAVPTTSYALGTAPQKGRTFLVDLTWIGP